jgi:preprotein translocase subunit SecG
VTAILAAAFFVTSIGLAILAGNGRQAPSIVDEVIQSAPVIPETPTVPTEQ